MDSPCYPRYGALRLIKDSHYFYSVPANKMLLWMELSSVHSLLCKAVTLFWIQNTGLCKKVIKLQITIATNCIPVLKKKREPHLCTQSVFNCLYKSPVIERIQIWELAFPTCLYSKIEICIFITVMHSGCSHIIFFFLLLYFAKAGVKMPIPGIMLHNFSTHSPDQEGSNISSVQCSNQHWKQKKIFHLEVFLKAKTKNTSSMPGICN